MMIYVPQSELGSSVVDN